MSTRPSRTEIHVCLQLPGKSSVVASAGARELLTPNPSVEPTNCGKPQSAAHLER